MFDLSSIYHPITAQKNEESKNYSPCNALKPYIATFWGTDTSLSSRKVKEESVLVIPDTCADIIFELNYRTNSFSSRFCGINDRPFTAQVQLGTTHVTNFAIRFHFWAVSFFADTSINNCLNIFADPDIYFPGWNNFFKTLLFQTNTLKDRVQIAENFLLSKLNENKMNNNVMNAAYFILHNKGTRQIKEICSYTAVSQRQLERLFLNHTGVSLKKVSNLVRYQNLWQDIAYKKKFDIQDEVAEYEYSDQAHLIREFKKYHGISPGQARKLLYGY